MAVDGDGIATRVFSEFLKLPSKGKPCKRSNGKEEWTVLASLVMILPSQEIIPVAISTGVKTMPDKVRKYSNGSIVNDLHAEILCLRLFNLWLLEEIGNNSNVYIEKYPTSKYALKDGIKLALLITEPPCGDASMSNVSDKLEDNTPWEDKTINKADNCEIAEINAVEVAEKFESKDESADKAKAEDCNFEKMFNHSNDKIERKKRKIDTEVHRGRYLLGKLGIVRTKPGRKDSPISYSKSCSDKLCLKQLTGITNCATSKLFEPIFLDYVVVPQDKYHQEDFDRCFRQRFTSKLKERTQNSKIYNYRPLDVLTYSNKEYKYFQDPEKVASPLSLLHNCLSNATEVLSNGVKDGAHKKNKPPHERGQSMICNRQFMKKLHKVDSKLVESFTSYMELKASNNQIQAQKELGRSILGSWVSTSVDDFTLDNHTA